MASPYRIQRLILCLGVLPFGILSLVWYIITFIMLFTEVSVTRQLALPEAAQSSVSDFRRRSSITSDEEVVSSYTRGYFPGLLETVFAVYIPTALMMLFSLSVLIWLIVVGCARSQSYIRSIRSELRALGAFSILGLCFMLWSIIGLMVYLGKGFQGLSPTYWLPMWFVLLFIWGWFFVATLFIAWIWEYVSTKKFADQHHESLRTMGEDNGSVSSATLYGKEPAHHNFA